MLFHCLIFFFLYLFLLDNVDLGTACGKYFRVSCLSIVDPGNTLIHCLLD